MEIHNILAHGSGIPCNNDNRHFSFTEMIKIQRNIISTMHGTIPTYLPIFHKLSSKFHDFFHKVDKITSEVVTIFLLMYCMCRNFQGV